jgi:hypothetical protein
MLWVVINLSARCQGCGVRGGLMPWLFKVFLNAVSDETL